MKENFSSRLPLWVWIAMSIANVAVCNVLNFSDMMWGNGALLSLIVSITHILIWAILLLMRRNDKRYLIFFCIFWFICVAAGVLGYCIYIEVITNAIMTTIGFLGLLFITPLYGIRFVFGDLHLTYMCLVALSIIYSIIGIALVKRKKTA